MKFESDSVSKVEKNNTIISQLESNNKVKKADVSSSSYQYLNNFVFHQKKNEK
jgi:hypothetical protein